MATTTPTTVGPFDVEREPERLTLRYDHTGRLNGQLLGFFLFSMMCVLTLGVLATVRSAHFGMITPADFVAPTKNHFGFLWLVMTLLLLVGAPALVAWLYKSPLIFVFNARNGTVLFNNQLITRFKKVEWVELRERRDPDAKYLYFIGLRHSDGQELAIHQGYDEEAARAVANEIARFIGAEVRWR